MDYSRRAPTIMVSSSIYGSENLLDQIYVSLKQIGYTVWMSRKGTIPVHSHINAFENCLRAVENCDIFLGIITPFYGSGRVEKEPSITHREMLKAIELKKLRYFLAHDHVIFARQILRQYRFHKDKKPVAEFSFRPTNVMDDIGVVEMYEAATREDIPDITQRTGNWVQPYSSNADALDFIAAQMSDLKAIKKILEGQV